MELEVYTSYNNITSPLGFSTKENYSAILNNKLAVSEHKFGKLNESYCLSVISDEQVSNVEQEINSANLFTKLEKLSIYSIQEGPHQDNLSFLSRV